MSVLFADVVGSTAMGDHLDAEQVADIMNGAFAFLNSAVARYGGTVARLMGDAILAFFGAPVAREDHAERAVRAGLEMQDQASQYAREVKLKYEIEFNLRVGINSGLTVLGVVGNDVKDEYTAMGDAINVAARLQSAARPGCVLIGPGTHTLVRQLFEVIPRGAIKVKGKAQRVRVFEVHAPTADAQEPHDRPLASRGLARRINSPLVGRTDEVQSFKRRLDELVAGRGGVVVIFGEAGLGKSRLLSEVHGHATQLSVEWLEGHALSFGRSISYWPFRQILQSYAQIVEGDEEDQAWAKLREQITLLMLDEAVETLPYLGMLLGLNVPDDVAQRLTRLDGEAIGHQIFRSARRFVGRLALRQPLCLVFEDIQWMDDSSTALLEHLLPLVKDVPLLVIGVSRPDPHTPGARLREVALLHQPTRYTEIRLSPLSPDDSTQLICNLLATDDLSVRARGAILEKAEGNPFFVEEVVRSLIDIGVIARDAKAGRWYATQAVDDLVVPDTIKGVIAARIDRLDEGVKEVLKVASVIGRSFFYRVLEGMVEAGEELDQRLAELQELELIVERRRTPELEYTFKHALTQEVAYESLLIRRRRALHLGVARSMEELFADRVEELYGVIAYHYTQGEAWERAHAFLLKAADSASKLAADREAIELYQRTTEAYAKAFGDQWDPVQRATLERKMGEALFRRGAHEQALTYYRRALGLLGYSLPSSPLGVRLAIAGQLLRHASIRVSSRIAHPRDGGPAPARVHEFNQICTSMAWMDYFLDQERFALDTLLQLNEAEDTGVGSIIVQSSVALGIAFDQIGLRWLGDRYVARGMRFATELHEPHTSAFANFGSGMHLHHAWGKFAAALDHYTEAAAAYRESGDFRRWAASTGYIAWMQRLSGALQQSSTTADGLARTAEDAADSHAMGWGNWLSGKALWHMGAIEQARDRLQRSIALFEGVPDYQFAAVAMSDLALCDLHEQRGSAAVSLAEASRRIVVQHRFRGYALTPVLNTLAEAYVSRAASAATTGQVAFLSETQAACAAALRQAELIPEGRPTALRLKGTYEWLAGNRQAADESWQNSLRSASNLNMPLEAATTCWEIGTRLSRQDYLERARSTFAELGAVTPGAAESA